MMPPIIDAKDYVGYSKLARFMSQNRDAAIFRRFGLLNMMNLLRLQAELQDLEQQLKEVWKEDREAVSPRRDFGKDFRTMRHHMEADSTQYDMLEEIGLKLREYNEALEDVLRLEKSTRPSAPDLEFLRQWLDHDGQGHKFLEGIEANTWHGEDDADYVCIKNSIRDGEDRLSKFMNGKLLDAYHATIGRHSKNEQKVLDGTIRRYQEDKIGRVGDGIVAAVSATLPTAAILVLYFVQNMVHRIGLVIVFTVIFSAALTVLTGAKRIEIFSATAAFAAVEVVYIGSTAGSP